jgi:hypothetical protein
MSHPISFRRNHLVIKVALAVAVGLIFGIGNATADSIPFTGSGTQNGFTNSAKVVFSLSGTTLTVTLSNTSPQTFDHDNGPTNVLQPTNVLSGVLFDISGNPTLTPGNAKLASGSKMVNTGSTADTSASGWGFGNPSGGSFNGQAYGIEAFGGIVTVPGNYANFANSNTSPNSKQKLDGIDYGIVGSGYVAGTGNGQLPTTPFEQTAEVFTFTVPSSFTSVNQISNVSFQYGTSNGEASFTGGTTPDIVVAPAPSSAVLLGVGGLGFVFVLARSRRRLPVAA